MNWFSKMLEKFVLKGLRMSAVSFQLSHYKYTLWTSNNLTQIIHQSPTKKYSKNPRKKTTQNLSLLFFSLSNFNRFLSIAWWTLCTEP